MMRNLIGKILTSCRELAFALYLLNLDFEFKGKNPSTYFKD
jgi:hypothetical protein